MLERDYYELPIETKENSKSALTQFELKSNPNFIFIFKYKCPTLCDVDQT